jgi:hypothetical protein
MRCAKARKSISLAMDGRLGTDGRVGLREHLRACLSCREWQKEQSLILERVKKPPEIKLSPEHRCDLYGALLNRINREPYRPRPILPLPAALRPVWQGAAVFLILVFSAFLGFFLGGRLEATAPDAEAAAFRQTMNLDSFADAPANSFVAVYDMLLQGELQ